MFVTHSHTDHIGAIVSHARTLTFSGKTPRYYVPADAAEHILRARDVGLLYIHPIV